MDPLLLSSAVALARRIRAREVSAREVVDAHIRHAERVNPQLHAIVRDRFEDARREADAADARLVRGDEDLPPFLGVPCTIKESFALTGMPWTAGLVARAGTVATHDAPTVARLRAAGMIPLGVTNTSELCMWMESTNQLYGRTGSAYDPARTAGGSSGGEGAIVGAGASPLGLGADIGGSIRMPAFFNGVFGHKPTPGLVPNAGQFPNAENDAQKMLGSGPLARRAEDLFAALKVLAGPHPDDAHTHAMDLHDPGTVDLRGVTVFDVRGATSLGPRSVDGRLLDAQSRAARALERRGARVREVDLPVLREAVQLWAAAMDAAADTPYAMMLGNGTTLRLRDVLREIPASLRGRSRYTLPSLGLCVLERVTKSLPVDMEKVLAHTQRAREELHTMLGDRGVMLYPSHTRVAPLHGAPLFWPVQWGYTAAFNVMHVPVTQVPLGLTPDGLPLGVQVVGAPRCDHVTLRVATELEDLFGGWVPPPRWV